MAVKFSSRSRIYALMIAVLWSLPGIAQAHVKWFCGVIDQSVPPAPPGEVLSHLYLTGLIGFTAAVMAGGVIDALLARFLPGTTAKSGKVAIIAEVILRLGMAIYALGLWLNLAVVPWADSASAAILTPELLAQGRLVALVQISIAVLVLIPRLSILAAIGIAALYAMGIAKYGSFYMIDYLFFPGVAAYLALSAPWLKRYHGLSTWRVPVLTASISFSLMWTAVEKFLFPQWTIFVLATHPGVTGGFPLATVATIAGFVEFSLAFYLLVGRAILGRVAAVLLMIVFLLAMPEFGMVDVIGHVSVISILLVVMLHGETRLQQVFRGDGTGVLASSARVGVRYVATLASLTMLYYGLHAVSAWVGTLD